MDSKKEQEEHKEKTKPCPIDLSKRYCLGVRWDTRIKGHMGGCLPSEEEMWEMDNK